MEEEIKVGCGVSASKDEKQVEVEENLVENVVEKKEEMQMIQVGRPAPLFQAEAYKDGKFINVNLEDYKGKWVVLCFYPGDFTFVWATEVAAVAAKYDEFQKLGVEVLSVSVDSVFVHKIDRKSVV